MILQCNGNIKKGLYLEICHTSCQNVTLVTTLAANVMTLVTIYRKSLPRQSQICIFLPRLLFQNLRSKPVIKAVMLSLKPWVLVLTWSLLKGQVRLELLPDMRPSATRQSQISRQRILLRDYFALMSMSATKSSRFTYSDLTLNTSASMSVTSHIMTLLKLLK